MKKKLKILMISSEAVPFAKVGGLADVSGVLPKYLQKLGHEVVMVLPRYYAVNKEQWNLAPVPGELSVPMGSAGVWNAAVCEGTLPGPDKVRVFFLEQEQLFGRDGIYADKNFTPFTDNDFRYVFLSRGGLEIARMLQFKPDIIHLHDWHTSSAAIMLRTVYASDPFFKGTKSVLTIHNMQYQGETLPSFTEIIECGWDKFTPENLAHNEKLNLLKCGLVNADLLTTVSSGYAREIMTPEYGFGLEGVVQKRTQDLTGILNGIDYEYWNPESDEYLAANFSAGNLQGKSLCKTDLQRTVDLPQTSDIPIIGMVTRLFKQKGIDVLAEAIHRILSLRVQFVLLGSGEPWAHFFFGDIMNQYNNKFRIQIAYDEPLAHKIEAGADFFLMPSRFEPCGLNQMYSMRYGTPPIVRATGGLDDTIENFKEETLEGTGFKFQDLTAGALYDTVGWAIHTYYNNKKGLTALQKTGMKKRFSWEESARQYVDVYRRALTS